VNAETAPTRGRIRTSQRLIVLLLGALSLGIALSGIAYAYWSAAGTGTATVSTGTLNPPTRVTAASTVAGAVTISWTAPTGTPGATGYDVVRTKTGSGTTANVCGTPAVHVTTTSCTDTGVAAGTYTYQVTAIYRSWTAQSAASNAVTVLVATKLAFTTQPSTASTAGTAFSVQPIVKVQDAEGNTAGSDSSVVTLALTTPAGATLTCTGGNAVTAASGIASFAGCKIDKSGTYTLTATDGSLTSAVSTAVTISAGTPAQLVFAQQPSNTAATSAISPAITVNVLDQFGNLTSSAAAVDVAIGTNPGAGVLSGTHPQPASSGVATFSNLSIDKAGAGYTLTATSAGLPSVTSNIFTISVGPATKLVFTQQPSGATTGIAFTTQPKVAVEDAGGNIVTTDTSTVALTKTIGTPATGGPGTLSGCSGVATNGTTTFSGCKLDTVGTGYTLTANNGSLPVTASATFNVAAGAPAKLVFTTTVAGNQSATATATIGPWAVQVQDSAGNPVAANSAVTLALASSSSGTTFFTPTSSGSAAGPITIAAGSSTSANFYYADTKAGTPTLTVSGTVNSVTVTQAAAQVTVVAAGASKFLLTAPASSTAGSALTVTLTAQDAFGNTAVSYANGNHTITWSGAANSPGGDAPSYPTQSVSFSGGLSTTTLSASLVAAGSTTLTATAAPLAGSATISVNAGTPAKLAWSGISSTAGSAAGACYFSCTWNAIGRSKTWTASVSVTDANGNIVTNVGTGHSVGLTIATAGGVSPTSLTIPAIGVATTSSLTFTSDNANSWTTTTLTAASPGYASATVVFNK
jgi:hypothetical protein